MNLLFTNIGRRTYLVNFTLELQKKGYPVKIFVSDTSKCTAGFWVSKDVVHFITPRVSDNEEKYAEILLKKCLEYGIDIIIPLMDFELPILAAKKNIFKENGVKIIISDLDVINNCLDKRKQYNFCLENNIPIPKTYFSLDKFPDEFPVIKKKILGSGSVGLKKINKKDEMNDFNIDEDMLQEFIEGKEFGMDILNDLNGNFLHADFREKIAMRAGESDKARTVFSQRFTKLAKKVSNVFKHIGNMDIDFIVDKDDNIYFVDFNPRFGGGYPITHLSGFNYLKYILDIVQFGEVEIPDKKRDVVVMKGISLHYFEVKNENLYNC